MWEIIIATTTESFEIKGTTEEVKEKFKSALFWCKTDTTVKIKIRYIQESFNKWYKRRTKEDYSSEISITFDEPIALGDAVEGILQGQGLEHLIQ